MPRKYTNITKCYFTFCISKCWFDTVNDNNSTFHILSTAVCLGEELHQLLVSFLCLHVVDNASFIINCYGQKLNKIVFFCICYWWIGWLVLGTLKMDSLTFYLFTIRFSHKMHNRSVVKGWVMDR